MLEERGCADAAPCALHATLYEAHDAFTERLADAVARRPCRHRRAAHGRAPARPTPRRRSRRRGRARSPAASQPRRLARLTSARAGSAAQRDAGPAPGRCQRRLGPHGVAARHRIGQQPVRLDHRLHGVLRPDARHEEQQLALQRRVGGRQPAGCPPRPRSRRGWRGARRRRDPTARRRASARAPRAARGCRRTSAPSDERDPQRTELERRPVTVQVGALRRGRHRHPHAAVRLVHQQPVAGQLAERRPQRVPRRRRTPPPAPSRSGVRPAPGRRRGCASGARSTSASTVETRDSGIGSAMTVTLCHNRWMDSGETPLTERRAMGEVLVAAIMFGTTGTARALGAAWPARSASAPPGSRSAARCWSASRGTPASASRPASRALLLLLAGRTDGRVPARFLRRPRQGRRRDRHRRHDRLLPAAGGLHRDARRPGPPDPALVRRHRLGRRRRGAAGRPRRRRRPRRHRPGAAVGPRLRGLHRHRQEHHRPRRTRRRRDRVGVRHRRPAAAAGAAADLARLDRRRRPDSSPRSTSASCRPRSPTCCSSAASAGSRPPRSRRWCWPSRSSRRCSVSSCWTNASQRPRSWGAAWCWPASSCWRPALRPRGRRRRAPCARGALVGGDLGLAVERQGDVVPAVQQVLAACRIGLERRLATRRQRHDLALQVDRHLGRRSGQQLGHVVGSEHDAEQADLGAVGAEDVGVRRRDDGAVAPVLQGPRRVLARRARAEVGAGDEDLRVPELGPCEHEVGIVVAPVEEQELAEAGALDALQELLRDDLVGVDVGAVQRRGRTRAA